MSKKKIKDSENKFVPFAVADMLHESLAKFKAPLWEDICKFKEISAAITEINENKNSKHAELLENFKTKFEVEDLRTLEEDSKELKEINTEYTNKILMGYSDISVDKTRLFSKEDFSRVYNPESFTASDAIALSYWLVKE